MQKPRPEKRKPVVECSGYPDWIPVATTLAGALAHPGEAVRYGLTYRKFLDGAGRRRREEHPTGKLVTPSSFPVEVVLFNQDGKQITGPTYVDPSWKGAKSEVRPLSLPEYEKLYVAWYGRTRREQRRGTLPPQPGDEALEADGHQQRRGIRTITEDLAALAEQLQSKWKRLHTQLGKDSLVLFILEQMSFGADLDALTQLTTELTLKSVERSGAPYKGKTG